MRNLSIKLKITLWYTAFMALLIILTLIVLFSYSSACVRAVSPVISVSEGT